MQGVVVHLFVSLHVLHVLTNLLVIQSCFREQMVLNLINSENFGADSHKFILWTLNDCLINHSYPYELKYSKHFPHLILYYSKKTLQFLNVLTILIIFFSDHLLLYDQVLIQSNPFFQFSVRLFFFFQMMVQLISINYQACYYHQYQSTDSFAVARFLNHPTVLTMRFGENLFIKKNPIRASL